MKTYLMTLDGKESFVMRWVWNKTKLLYEAYTDEQFHSAEADLLEEFDNEFGEHYPNLYHDPTYERMLQSIDFIVDFLVNHYLENVSFRSYITDIYFYAYDKDTYRLILEYVPRGF